MDCTLYYNGIGINDFTVYSKQEALKYVKSRFAAPVNGSFVIIVGGHFAVNKPFIEASKVRGQKAVFVDHSAL